MAGECFKVIKKKFQVRLLKEELQVKYWEDNVCKTICCITLTQFSCVFCAMKCILSKIKEKQLLYPFTDFTDCLKLASSKRVHKILNVSRCFFTSFSSGYSFPYSLYLTSKKKSQIILWFIISTFSRQKQEVTLKSNFSTNLKSNQIYTHM